MAKAVKKAGNKKAEAVAKKPVPKPAAVAKPAAKKKVVVEKKPEPLVEEKVVAVVVEEEMCPCPEPVGGTGFDEFTIKEIMVQKNISREKAIEILRNPQ